MVPDWFWLILMQAANHSRVVHSSQAGIHPRLESLLERYAGSTWEQPVHPASSVAFDALVPLVEGDDRPLVLDSGCGTGASTRILARRHPECLVIGVDKSAERLSRLGADRFPWVAENAVWIRAELATFWRLAVEAGWILECHYLLYPNPWPKPGQLQRRWHAHPVFSEVLRLGGRLELRTNWKIYADEFAFALNRLTGSMVEPVALEVLDPVSPFERKYRDSGHALYSVVVLL